MEHCHRPAENQRVKKASHLCLHSQFTSLFRRNRPPRTLPNSEPAYRPTWNSAWMLYAASLLWQLLLPSPWQTCRLEMSEWHWRQLLRGPGVKCKIATWQQTNNTTIIYCTIYVSAQCRRLWSCDTVKTHRCVWHFAVHKRTTNWQHSPYQAYFMQCVHMHSTRTVHLHCLHLRSKRDACGP